MNYKQTYSFWSDPIKIWKFTFKSWEVLMAAMWTFFSFSGLLLGTLAFNFRIPWWAIAFGIAIPLASYLSRTKVVYKVSLYLGFPYVFRKQGVKPTDKPLLGSLSRWAIRTTNAVGISVWISWAVYIVVRMMVQEGWQLDALASVSILLGIATFLPNFSFFMLLDKIFLFKRTRFALLVSVLIWVGFILAFRSWEFQVNNRIFCPFYLCLGG